MLLLLRVLRRSGKTETVRGKQRGGPEMLMEVGAGGADVTAGGTTRPRPRDPWVE